MKSRTTSFLWSGDAKWITSAFLAYLLSLIVFGLSNFSSAVLSSTGVFVPVLLFAGGMAGLRSSRMFGGRRNFTGRLLLILSISTTLFGLSTLVSWVDSFYEPNAFGSSSIYNNFGAGLVVLGIFTAAFAILVSAKATVVRLDRGIIERILVAVGITLVSDLIVLTSHLPGGILVALSFNISETLLLAGALILVGQLGKWYAAPGIGIVVYGYAIVSFLPSIGGPLAFSLLQFGIKPTVALALFSFEISVIFFFVGLGLSKVRPRLGGPERPRGTVS